jgi:hypothetical protein
MRGIERTLAALALAASAAALSACGGGGDGGCTTCPPPPTPTPPPATIQASGNGIIKLHPSLDQRFVAALEIPLTLTESTGGSADWNFARYSVIRGGTEIERNELGSDDIRQGGFSRINPRSTVTPTLVFRQNALDFDALAITLGFTDIVDGRQFTVDVPFTSFRGVDVSLIPMLAPSDHVRP